LNLVGNAIKFTEAGEVVLSMTAVSRSEQAVTLDIAVQDTGIGIAPEHQRKIFEGFTQAEVSTSRRFGGTGLGVAICQRLIRLMGGELSLVSEPGQGSRFSFRVELAMVGPTAESGSPALAGRSVLLVESQAAVRGAGLRLLQGLGARTEAVADLTGAIEQACRAGQAWDAVIVGWRVAGIDGWSACGRLRSAGLPPGTRLLLCGGLHDHARLAELAEADPRRIDGFLTAPLTARGLTEVLLGAGGSLLGAASGVEGGGQRLAGLRLLVAEDNANNRQIARELLEGEGAVVTVVDDGLRAVGAVAAGPELFDAVLMDLQMPRLDGLAAARRIREELGLRKLPIVAMTANAMSSDREACLQAGMDDHVGKPFALAALVAVLQRLCRMGETGREALAAFPSRPVGPRLPAAAVWLAEIHGLDLDAAVERMGYRLDVYRRMLRRFAEGLPSQVPAMLQHGRDGQWDESHRAAHALKGLAATLGATALADTAARAEAAIGERCACDASMGALAALDAACGTASQVLQALAEALDGGSQPDTAPSGWCESTARASEPAHAADTVPAAPDDRVLRDGLAELDRLLEDSDMDALSCVESLRAAGERRFGSAWTTLDETVLLLDFGAARRECRRLMYTLGWTPIVMPA
jgi:CheY-like chemotaxis protein/HPt (histidine-containing phosphotransfer) domain-containing protein